jgi:hypothetical protein
MANVLGFIKTAAPWITAAATGNIPGLVSLAAQAISNVTGKNVKADPDSIAAAVAGATPEQLLALKQADAELQVKLQALGFEHIEDLEKIAADDRASARNREIAVKDKIPAILAIVITSGFFGVLTFMLMHEIPANGHDAMLMILGALITAWTAVVSYYFGSSAGSAAKDKTISDIAKT